MSCSMGIGSKHQSNTENLIRPALDVIVFGGDARQILGLCPAGCQDTGRYRTGEE